MKLRDKIQSLTSILKVKFLNRRIPLAVRLQVTNRCTLQCKYCNLWSLKTGEPGTEEIFGLIKQLSLLGTKRISISGGEPLLRGDIAEIINYCCENGIYPEMNSNGRLVPGMIKEIKNLSFLKLSLDGPEEAHDLIRGKGSYRDVISAAEAAYKNNINFGFATTLTKYNIDFLDHLLVVAKRYGTIVAFQPIKKLYRGINDIEELAPPEGKFKQAIGKLILEKKSGNIHIRNTLDNLWHIYNWPIYRKIKCWAGRIFCIIDVTGDLYPCDRVNYGVLLPNCIKIGVEEAMGNLPEVHCSGCGFCGSLELNYLMSFKINILSSIKKIIGKI